MPLSSSDKQGKLSKWLCHDYSTVYLSRVLSLSSSLLSSLSVMSVSLTNWCILSQVLLLLCLFLYSVSGSGNTNLDNFEPAWFLLQNHHGTRYVVYSLVLLW